jgi:peptidoglycan/xylan/chitin deacetylase (PgdA/CDA1 family)
MLRIAISFDYDSPAGYRESFHMRDFPANADYQGTELLLKVLRRHDVKVTFGVVGQAALPGKLWDHCQEQIREIHRAGHEIASHSMNHRYLPSLRDNELLKEVASSKCALEGCIGSTVQGFIPPFNRPSHFPEAGAFSFSEFLGFDGRGRGRQSVGMLLRTLRRAGYGWSRVSFQSKYYQIGLRLGIMARREPLQPFVFQNVVAIPLHQTGFGSDAHALIQRWMGTDLVLTLYGHPNQALSSNGQNADELDCLLSEFRLARDERKLVFNSMAEIAAITRGEPVNVKREVLVQTATAC